MGHVKLKTPPQAIATPSRSDGLDLSLAFAWINKYHRCVRDYETLPEHHETMVHVSMIMTMSRRLARSGDR